MNAAARLAVIAEEYWEGLLALEPLHATAIGDRRFDDRLPDISPAGRARTKHYLEGVLESTKEIRRSDLPDDAQITRDALTADVERRLAKLRCGVDEWSVDPLAGPQVSLLNVESYQPIRTIAEARAMVARWEAMGPLVDQHASNLRESLARGKVAVRDCVEKVIDELQDFRVGPDNASPLLKPVATIPEDWPEAERERFRSGLTKAVRESIRPAFDRYLRMLREELLPRSRPSSKAGILYVPDGAESYTKLIEVYTSLPLSSERIHATGLGEVDRIRHEMEDLGEEVFGVRDWREILQRLRTDPDLYFRTPDEVKAKAEAALARSKAAIPEWFGRQPKADCVVVPMGEHEAKHSTIAYYRQPASDGSRPGSYYVNTSAPETRPRYEAEALAYHESIPGHHLQLAIMQELTHLPAFRRHSGVTAFIEGWGLYTERLADGMGLYTSDLDRIGMLSYDAWRACRLVVDTGIHGMRWSRQQAIDFMFENTALARNNIVNEVDRYIAWPGQALAYKIGQLEILRLRDLAVAKLGESFDPRAFHDAVLENGAVALSVLADAVNRYISRALNSSTR